MDDGIGPDGFADPAPYLPTTRILVTLTPRTEAIDDLEVMHTPNVEPREVAEILATVAEILTAAGPGVCVASGVIFGGIEHHG